MKKILFIRHSKTITNEQGIAQSDKLDFGLTQEGKSIAIHKAEEITKEGYNFKIAYVTPTLRAKETLKEIVNVLRQKPIVIQEPLLIERSFGEYDGKPFSDLMNAFNSEGPNPKGVESVEDFINRIRLATDKIINTNTDGDILVITHSNVVGAIYCLINEPEKVNKYWLEYPTPSYCEGFRYVISEKRT